MGKREGVADGAGNGLVGPNCLMYISIHRPRVFLLENVAAITSAKHRCDFEMMMNCLLSIKSHGQAKPFYTLFWKDMNSLHYGLWEELHVSLPCA